MPARLLVKKNPKAWIVVIVFRNEKDFPPQDKRESKLPFALELSPEESRHLRALRLRAGAQILVSDGQGRRLYARLLSEREALVEKEGKASPSPPKRVLLVAIPEGKRWDWLLQKSAELGSTHILPLLTQRSQRSSYPKERSQKILKEACSQSRNFYLPLLYEAQEIKNLLGSKLWQELQEKLTLFLLSPKKGPFLSSLSLPAPEGGGCKDGMAFFIGPEGGFTKAEEELLIHAGARPCHLGERILRIETAALAALARSLA